MKVYRMRRKCFDCGEEFTISNPRSKFCEEHSTDAAYYQRNLKLISQKAKARNQNNYEQRRAKHYRLAYGLTLSQKQERIDSQKGLCGACGTDDPGKRGWHTDHDHRTEKLRGELCANCNRALGYADDDIARLYKLIIYLERYSGGETF